MNPLSLRISSLHKLGEYMQSMPNELKQVMQVAYHHNGWFDIDNQERAIIRIAKHYLQQNHLESFVAKYKLAISPKKIGLILAGNIPLVGFHDIVCCLLCGHHVVIKCSSKDHLLIPFLIDKLIDLSPKQLFSIEYTQERLPAFDAIIATGSDNSARYFSQYFVKYPNIIRKNRTSVAVLTGKENKEDLQALGHDIFDYYGLGCRSVSKLFVPKDYQFTALLETLDTFEQVIQNTKYKNNFDYSLTLLLLNQIPHYANNNVMLVENNALHSRIATLHYQEYENIDEVKQWTKEHESSIQVIIGDDFAPFGTSQSPTLADFADNIDTMEFLTTL